MTGSILVNSAHKGSNKKFVVSLYTPTQDAAVIIATEAGTILGSPGAVHHLAKKTGYFHHYHPGADYASISHPHAFYGQPV